MNLYKGRRPRHQIFKGDFYAADLLARLHLGEGLMSCECRPTIPAPACRGRPELAPHRIGGLFAAGRANVERSDRLLYREGLFTYSLARWAIRGRQIPNHMDRTRLPLGSPAPETCQGGKTAGAQAFEARLVGIAVCRSSSRSVAGRDGGAPRCGRGPFRPRPRRSRRQGRWQKSSISACAVFWLSVAADSRRLDRRLFQRCPTVYRH